jgi:hypothetical protein
VTEQERQDIDYAIKGMQGVVTAWETFPSLFAGNLPELIQQSNTAIKYLKAALDSDREDREHDEA